MTNSLGQGITKTIKDQATRISGFEVRDATLITRGTITAYDSATHTATVTVRGESFAGIPLCYSILPYLAVAAVAAGATVGILGFSSSVPGNGCIVEITVSTPPPTGMTAVDGTFTGGVNIGSATGAPAANLYATSDSQAAVKLFTYSDSSFSTFFGLRARGTLASPSAVQNGDDLFRFTAWGYGATGWCSSLRAGILFRAAENWTNTAQGTLLYFSVTPVGSASSSVVLALTSSGLYIGGAGTPTGPLDVSGNDIRIRTSQTPASASAAGNAGEICWDSNYVYVCVATNTWKRAALSSW